MHEYQFSFFIPTFNRCNSLSITLESIINQLNTDDNIPIYISDNKSSDNTSDVVKKWRNIYPLIHYNVNNSNLGIDRNMQKVVSFTKSKYCLMLGDDDILEENSINYIKQIIKRDFDFAVLRFDDTYKATIEFNNINNAFAKLWNKMPYGTLLINTTNLKSLSLDKYIGTKHLYSAIAWELLKSKKTTGKCIFLGDIKMIKTGIIQKTWENESFEILFHDIPYWFDILPQKLEPTKSLVKKVYIKNLTSLISLLKYRALNKINKNNKSNILILKDNAFYHFKINLIIILPKNISKLAYFVFYLFSKTKNLLFLKKSFPL